MTVLRASLDCCGGERRALLRDALRILRSSAEHVMHCRMPAFCVRTARRVHSTALRRTESILVIYVYRTINDRTATSRA